MRLWVLHREGLRELLGALDAELLFVGRHPLLHTSPSQTQTVTLSIIATNWQ